MPELSEKLDRFTALLLSQAAAENERTMQELKEKHDAALSSAEDQILLEAYTYIHGEVSRIRSEQGRKVSRHLLECKQALYRRREEIAGEVFSLVRERIGTFTATPAYAGQLRARLLEAAARLEGAEDLALYLRSADLPLGAQLREALPGRSLDIHPGPFVLGGLILESDSLRLRLDASYDTAMEELSGHFASLVGLSLAAPADEIPEEGGAQA
ncbi:MAG: V-type ATP synthase subunit E [Clostridiales bacterium]|nr:V-type ATP synthase subunit E [Clostridiales bacterium]